MPSINDRIGSQNVIRVLSNASAPPTRLVNMNDVDTARKSEDGLILVWDQTSAKFILTDKIDAVRLTQSGISSISNTTDSSTFNTGALVVSGGVGIAKNLTLGAGFVAAGVGTFTSNIDANQSVDIFRDLTVNNNVNVSGVSTFVGVSTFGGDVYIGGDLYLQDDLVLDDISGNSLNITGNSIVNTLTATAINATSFANLNVTGISTFNNDVVFKGANSSASWDYSASDLTFFNDTRLIFGSNDDFEIWHGGSHTYLKNSGGDLRIRGNKILLKREDGSETYLEANVNEDVKLFYNNVNRVETTDYGAKVTGILSATSITADNITLDSIDGGTY